MKIINYALSAIALSTLVFFGSGCATILAPKTTPLVLVDAPSDLVVTDSNGNVLEIESVLSSVSGRTDGSVSFYGAGVNLNKKPKTQTVTLTSNGVSQEVKVMMGADGKWIIIDLFVGGPIAWVIDGTTGKWRKVKNKYVDVPAVMSGAKSRGQGKLKRTVKREAKG
ncbi:MAG: hypothetical protein GC181_02930 [Bacteroidetes bacterium]|nr:hypothetical protein [Bacteroidota bacterium]